jgi:hypothetical protein
MIEVALRNESSGMLRAGDSQLLADYDFTLRDARGYTIAFNVQTQKQADRARNGPVFRSTWQEVQPGADFKESFDLNEMYDLKPGNYSLTVTRIGVLEPDSTRFVRPTGVVSPALVFEIQP